MWLRSLLISALSACLAVWTTLQYQAWVDRRPSPLSEDDSPKIAPRKTEQAEPAEPAEQAEQAEPAIQASSIAVKVDQGEVVVEPPTVEASEDTAVHGSLGAELVAAGDVDEGIRVLEAETSADAYNAYNLGVAWQSKGETDKAIAAYAQAIELAPTLAPPRVNLGAQLLQRGRLLEAEAVLLTAVKVGDDAPTLAAAHSNLGAVLKRSERYEEALESYAQAVRWGAARSSLVSISKLHMELGHPHQALEACRRALLEDGDPLDTSPLLQAGLILESLGSLEDAADHFAKVMELDADNSEAAVHLGNCQLQRERYHEALETFIQASRLEPENAEIYDMIHSAVNEAKTAIGCDVTDGLGGGKDPGDEGAGFVKTTDAKYAKASLEEKQAGMAEVGSETADAGGRGRIEDDALVGGTSREIEEQAAVTAAGVAEAELQRDTAAASRKPASVVSELDPEGAVAVKTETEVHGQDSGPREEASASDDSLSRVEIEVETSTDTDARQGGAGIVSTKALPGRAVPSIRADAADMRRQSEALSQHDATPGSTARGFFIPRSKQEAEGLEESGDVADPAPDVPGGGGGSEPGHDAALTMGEGANDDDGVPAKARPILEGHREPLGISVEPSGSVEAGNGRGTGVGTDVAAPKEGTHSANEAGTPSAGSERWLLAPSGDERVVDEAVGDKEAMPSVGAVVLPAGEERVGADAVPGGGSTSAVLDSERESLANSNQEQGLPAEEGLGDDLAKDGDDFLLEDQSSAMPSPPETDAPEDVAISDVANDDGKEDAAVPAVGQSQELPGATVDGEIGAMHDEFDDLGSKPAEGVAKVKGADVELVENADVSGIGREFGAADPESVSGAPSFPGERDVAGGGDIAAESEGNVGLAERPSLAGDTAEPGGMMDEREAGLAEGIEGKIDKVENQPAEDSAAPTEEADMAGDTPRSGASIDEAAKRSEDGAQEQTTGDGGKPLAGPPPTGPGLLEAPMTETENTDEARDVSGDASEQSPGSAAPVAAHEERKELDSPAEVDEEQRTGTAAGGEAIVAGQEERAAEGGLDDASGRGAAGTDADVDVGAVDSDDGGPAVATVSEEDARRARSKTKLGLARLQQGNTKKALPLFEKAASIDPGWWGGFFYSALAHDVLGNADAAARALTSALSVPAPTEAQEVAELEALVSKVLASLGDDKGSVAGPLKAAMNSSGLTFATVEPPSAGATGGGAGTPRGGGAGRTASMGGAQEAPRGAGTGLEADLANLRKMAKKDDSTPPDASRGGGIENTNKNQWRFSGGGDGGRGGPTIGSPPPAGGAGSSRGGGVGALPGSSRGGVPGMSRGEGSPSPTQSPGGPNYPQDKGRAGKDHGIDGRSDDGRLRDGGPAGRDAQTRPDAAPRRGWGWGGGGGGGRGGRKVDKGAGAGSPQGSPDAPGRGGSGGGDGSRSRGGQGGNGASPAAVDSKASVEDILASMGLNSEVGLGPDGRPGVGSVTPRRPEDLMADAGGGESGGGGKRGVFGRIWNKGKKK